MRKLLQFLEACVVIVVLLGYGVAFLKTIVEPIAPIVTVMFVAVGTLFALETPKTAGLVIGGLLLYPFSWPLTALLGPWVGGLVCMVAVIMWMLGAFRPFDR